MYVFDVNSFPIPKKLKNSIPDILISTNRTVFAVIGKKMRSIDFIKPSTQGAPHYWGLTWNDHVFSVATENMLVLYPSDDSPPRYMESDEFSDIHQCYFFGDNLYVINTGKNSVVRFDFIKKKVFEITHITNSGDKSKKEDNHINSFYEKDGFFYVCYHNHDRPSYIKKFTHEFKEVDKYENIGNQNHNVYIEDDTLYTFDSFGGKFIAYDTKKKQKIREIPLNVKDKIPNKCTFGRGLARTKDYFILGISEQAERERRALVRSVLLFLDNNLEYVDRLFLPQSCQIKDIRVISEPDFAHNGVEFPKLIHKRFSKEIINKND